MSGSTPAFRNAMIVSRVYSNSALAILSASMPSQAFGIGWPNGSAQVSE